MVAAAAESLRRQASGKGQAWRSERPWRWRRGKHRNGAQGGTRTQGGTSRGSHCSHLGTGGSGGNAARVGRDKSVRVRCLLKESELHSVENAETLRRDTVRADSGRPRGDNVKHR